MLSSLFNKMSSQTALYQRLSDVDTIAEAIKSLQQANKHLRKNTFDIGDDKNKEQAVFIKNIDTALHYRTQIQNHDMTHRFDHVLCDFLSENIVKGLAPVPSQMTKYYNQITHDAANTRTYPQHGRYLMTAAHLNKALSLTDEPKKYSNASLDKISSDAYNILRNITDYSHEEIMLKPVLSFHQTACAMGHVFKNAPILNLSAYYRTSSQGGINTGLAERLAKAAATFQLLNEENSQKRTTMSAEAKQTPKTPPAQTKEVPSIKKLRR